MGEIANGQSLAFSERSHSCMLFSSSAWNKCYTNNRQSRDSNRGITNAGSMSHNFVLWPLSGPVRDTPPYRAIPFRDSIAEGGIAPICLVFIGYRTSIAEIPLSRGGYRTSTSHALQGGNTQKRGRGYRTQLAMLRHQKPHSAQ